MTPPPANPAALLPTPRTDAPKIWSDDAKQLMQAAKLLDAEAATWADGWAVQGVWTGNKDDEWARVRHHRLIVAAQNLRSIASRKIKSPTTQL